MAVLLYCAFHLKINKNNIKITDEISASNNITKTTESYQNDFACRIPNLALRESHKESFKGKLILSFLYWGMAQPSFYLLLANLAFYV